MDDKKETSADSLWCKEGFFFNKRKGIYRAVFTCTQTYICHILLKLAPLLHNVNLMSDDPVSTLQSRFPTQSTHVAHLNPLFGFHVNHLFMFLNIY